MLDVLAILNSKYHHPFFVFTFSFMHSQAPELRDILIGNKNLTPNMIQRYLQSADVYAFGILVGEILTGYCEVIAYKGDESREIYDYNVCYRLFS